MTKRRSLTPSTRRRAGELHATRRIAARHGVSMRVTLKARSGEVLKGWALNVSRGGVRVVIDGSVELGGEFEVTLSTGADPGTSCIGRVVWVQEEPDGVVCGIELVDP
ncbi:MAG: PilZ domain-containing protein [Myxococcota bacterium]|nr:PilZ domain-containing protein [Myxococcota bacterium]